MVPAQDVVWTCPDCRTEYRFTILWQVLDQDAGIQCPDCQAPPIWIRPPATHPPL